MKKRAFCFAAFLFGAVVFLQNPLFLYAQSILILLPKAATPTEEIKATIEYAQSVLNDPSLPETAKNERVKKATYDRFDFTEMSKRVLARHWTELAPAEQNEFVVLFTELLERVYFTRIKLIQDAKFSYSDRGVDKDLATVRSKATTAKGETFELEYRLRFSENRWKIYDVSVEGISLVSN
ncbi:MAG: ABC transporter substrate-binding protein, partial [Candidatus Sungiibacteriota bacterium]